MGLLTSTGPDKQENTYRWLVDAGSLYNSSPVVLVWILLNKKIYCYLDVVKRLKTSCAVYVLLINRTRSQFTDAKLDVKLVVVVFSVVVIHLSHLCWKVVVNQCDTVSKTPS